MLTKLWEIVVWIFRGQNILFFAAAMGILYSAFIKVKKVVIVKQTNMIRRETKKENVQQNERITKIEDSMSDLSDSMVDLRVDVIRMQILQGIQSESFSKSELTYFYDKYTKLGGNSFVSVKVQAYLERDDIK